MRLNPKVLNFMFMCVIRVIANWLNSSTNTRQKRMTPLLSTPVEIFSFFFPETIYLVFHYLAFFSDLSDINWTNFSSRLLFLQVAQIWHFYKLIVNQLTSLHSSHIFEHTTRRVKGFYIIHLHLPRFSFLPRRPKKSILWTGSEASYMLGTNITLAVCVSAHCLLWSLPKGHTEIIAVYMNFSGLISPAWLETAELTSLKLFLEAWWTIRSKNIISLF